MVLLVVVLRGPLRDLLPLLRKLKYKEFEVLFDRRLEIVKEEAASELPETPGELPPRDHREDLYLQLVAVSPRSAVIEAWRQVEHAALEAADRAGLDYPSNIFAAPRRLVDLLARSGFLDSGKVSLLNELRILRNQAVHAPDFAITTDAAVEYGLIARRLARYLADLPSEAHRNKQ